MFTFLQSKLCTYLHCFDDKLFCSIFSFFGNLFRPRRPNQGGVPVISPQGDVEHHPPISGLSYLFSFSWHLDGIWINFNFYFRFQLPCASTDHPRWETAQCRGCIRKQVRKRKTKLEEQEKNTWKERENLKLEFSFWFWKLCLHLFTYINTSCITGHSLLSSWRLMVGWWVFWILIFAWLSLCFILETSWVALYSDVCQSVSEASVSPDQISTFSNI